MERVVYLGQEVTASAFFTDDKCNPVQPVNPSLYPNYKVIDPMQDMVLAGVGTYNENTGAYDATITIPETASLSLDSSKYHIVWNMVDDNKKEYSYVESFDVVHPSYDLTEAKEQQKLVLPITSIEMSLPLPRRVMDVSLKIFDKAGTEVISAIPKQMGLYSEYYIYSTTIPEGIFQSANDYMAVWIMKDSGNTCVFTQVIHCASLWDMGKISDLRMYLDKVSKAVDTYQGYKDSELYFYLQQGSEYINSVKIPTNWTLESYQTMYQLQGMAYWLLEAAKWSALRAQYLAEGDSTFDFSGQPVSLSVDRTGFIESELGRVQGGLENQLPLIKAQVVKNMKPVGHLNLSWPSIGYRYPYMESITVAGIPLHRMPHLRI